MSFVAAARIGIRGSCAESAGCERALQQSEDVFGGLLDQELIDLFALEFEADEKASVGEQIDEAWDAAGEAVDDFDGGAGERAGAAEASGVETLGHVSANFGQAERTQQARAGDALLERLKFGALEHGEKFRLTAENDLKQFFLIRVGVAEEANFFEQLDAHEVRFVDQKDCGATLLLRLEKHLVKRGQASRLAGGGAINFVFLENGFEQFARRERRIDKEGGDEAAAALGFFGEDLKSSVKKSCFACAHRAGDYGETFALQNTLQKNFERSAVRIRQMKESGVRSEPKRFFFELIKGRVQIDLPRVPNSNCEQIDSTTDEALFLPDSQFYNKHRVPA